MPAVVAVSVGGHLLLAFFLMRVPVGQELIRKVIPIQMVQTEAPKPKPPEPKKEPPKAKVKGAKQAAKARPAASRPAASPTQPGNAAQTFGMSAGEGEGGTMAVPVGETLEAESTASAPAPLVLDVSDEAGATSALDRLPAPIGSLRVAYPEVARLSGQSGSAVVVAYVEADGRVASAEVVSSSNRTFAKAALDAVRGTRFKAAERNGVRVAASIRIPVRFELAEAKVEARIEPEPDADPADLAVPEATPSSATTGATP